MESPPVESPPPFALDILALSNTRALGLLSAVSVGGGAALSDALAEGITREDFPEPVTRQVWEALEAVAAKGGEISQKSLTAALCDAPLHKSVPVPSLAEQLFERGEPENTRLYAKMVKEVSLSRQIDSEMSALYNEFLAAGGREPDAFARRVMESMADLLQGSSAAAEGSTLGAAAAGEVAAIRAEYEDPRGLRGLTTGLPSLNRLLGGLCPGRLTVIVSGSGVGKSMLAAGLAHAAAKHDRASVHYFSLEMTAPEITRRLLFSESGVSSRALEDKAMTGAAWRALEGAKERLDRLPITFYDDGRTHLSQIGALCRGAKARGACDLIVVDYIQLVEGPREKDGSREREVAAVARGLKSLAQTLRVPVLAVSQVNEEGKSRESRAIFQEANAYLHLLRDGECYSLYLEKQREGRDHITIPLAFNKELCRISEEDNWHEPS